LGFSLIPLPRILNRYRHHIPFRDAPYAVKNEASNERERWRRCYTQYRRFSRLDDLNFLHHVMLCSPGELKFKNLLVYTVGQVMSPANCQY